MDFRQATDQFADPDFDGEPVQCEEYSIDTEIKIVEAVKENEAMYGLTKQEQVYLKDSDEAPRKYYVKGVSVKVVNERVLYYDNDGKLITESLKDYTKKSLTKEFTSMDTFLKTWNSSDKKSTILKKLEEEGVLFEELKTEVGRDYDAFDLICHVAFDKKPLTRKERANNVKKRDYFAKYGDKAKSVIEALLQKYSDEGLENLESMKILKVNPLREFGTPVEIVKLFGGKTGYLNAIHELESELYAEA